MNATDVKAAKAAIEGVKAKCPLHGSDFVFRDLGDLLEAKTPCCRRSFVLHDLGQPVMGRVIERIKASPRPRWNGT